MLILIPDCFVTLLIDKLEENTCSTFLWLVCAATWLQCEPKAKEVNKKVISFFLEEVVILDFYRYLSFGQIIFSIHLISAWIWNSKLKICDLLFNFKEIAPVLK